MMHNHDLRSAFDALPNLACALALSAACLVPWTASAAEPAERGRATAKAASAWLYTGSMVAARSGHSATLLNDGRVLVVGGYSKERGVIAIAELYEPTTGAWTATGSPAVPQPSHTATRLMDGRVLIIGSGTASPEVYDPARGTFAITGSMIAPRSGYSTTLLQDGRVLVAGGWAGIDALNSAELYDPATGSWSPTGSLHIKRYDHTATLLRDGRVLVARGDNSGDLSETLSVAEIYDPASGAWNLVSDSNGAGVSHTATLLTDGRVLVAGGYGGYGRGAVAVRTELFDPATLTWRRSGDLLASRQGHTATRLPDGGVLITGGYPVDSAAVEQFDVASERARLAPRLNVARQAHTATLLNDGRVLVAGGADVHGSVIASAEVYGIAPPGTIAPEFTGAWYDPAQSGHGLLVEVLPGNRFLAIWFAFDPAGTQQAWFTGVGTYQDNVAEITDVRMPTGGRWIPNFDPNAIVHAAWGTLRFTFSDCDHGRVDFASVAGFGSGSMNLTRLTQPAGLTCP